MSDKIEVTREIAAALPYLRRYARALTGDQVAGDEVAATALQSLINEKQWVAQSSSPKIALFRAFHKIWTQNADAIQSTETGARGKAQARMSVLKNGAREALLLSTIESFRHETVAEIIEVPKDTVAEMIDRARENMKNDLTGNILVIEDEAIIAMDLEDLVRDMGHNVTGVAQTRAEAVDMAARHVPDLILADIQLADDSSGIEAVRDILRDLGARPVIFVTAFPERLLTGERPEPAFLIAKPFTVEQMQSAVSQAMFFSSVETLGG